MLADMVVSSAAYMYTIVPLHKLAIPVVHTCSKARHNRSLRSCVPLACCEAPLMYIHVHVYSCFVYNTCSPLTETSSNEVGFFNFLGSLYVRVYWSAVAWHHNFSTAQNVHNTCHKHSIEPVMYMYAHNHYGTSQYRP